MRAAWSEWSGAHELGPYTLGVEEEAMLLDPRTWALAHRIDDLLPRLSVEAQDHVSAETHGSAFEVQTDVRRTVKEAVNDLLGFRLELEETLETLGLRAAVSGTHPFAIWQEIAVSGGERYQFVYGSMRGVFSMLFGASALLFLREPTRSRMLFVRRCFWLSCFGILDSTLLLWPGDILLVYAIASPVILAFVDASPRRLIGASLISLLALSVWAYWRTASQAPEIVATLHREIARIVNAQDFRKFIFDSGLDYGGQPPAEFAAKVRSDYERWGRVIREAGIKLD